MKFSLSSPFLKGKFFPHTLTLPSSSSSSSTSPCLFSKYKSKHIKTCGDLMTELNNARISVNELLGSDARSAHFETKALLMRSYQASGIGKAPAVAEYVLEWLKGSGTQKVLVFAHHMDVLNIIEEAVSKDRTMKGVGHIRIDGSVPSIERAAR